MPNSAQRFCGSRARSCRGGFSARPRAGFTLLELLIVGALIALFAGIALFSVQQFYDSSRRKAIFGETRNTGTALGIAEQDVGFFPRLHVLGKPFNLLSYREGGNLFLIPGLDAYGLYTGAEQVTNMQKNWAAPYTAISETRRGFSQGATYLVKVRLPEQQVVNFSNSNYNEAVFGGDISLVDWPADTWGNPYVVYLVSADPDLAVAGSNPRGLRIAVPGEQPNYFAAIVSYGPNGVPGGNTDVDVPVEGDDSGQQFRANILEPARLYVEGDIVTGEGFVDGVPAFTMKSLSENVPAQLDLLSNQFVDVLLPRSIHSDTANPLEIGIRDSGSDDIWWAF